MSDLDPVIVRAIELLERYRKFPTMLASDYEAWICIVSTIIVFAIPKFNNRDFHAKHLGTLNSAYLNLDKKLNTEWALSVIDDALDILKRWKLKAFS